MVTSDTQELSPEINESAKFGEEEALPLYLYLSLAASRADESHPSPIDKDSTVREIIEDVVRRLASVKGFYDIDIDTAVEAALVKLRKLDELDGQISLEAEGEIVDEEKKDETG